MVTGQSRFGLAVALAQLGGGVVTFSKAPMSQAGPCGRVTPVEAYCVHLWEQVAWERYLKDLDVDFIRSVDTNFNRLARRFLDS